MDWGLFPMPFEGVPLVVPLGAAEWIVVRVVVSDRTEGAGDENVLSAPCAELTPTVVFPSPEDAA